MGYLINCRSTCCDHWHENRLLLCESCKQAALRQYPQGWKEVPGDTCRHLKLIFEEHCPICDKEFHAAIPEWELERILG